MSNQGERELARDQKKKKGTMNRITDSGLERIREFLADNHKQRDFTADQLYAWAASAEDDMDNDVSPTIEIRAHDSITGAAVTLSLSSSDFIDE